MKYIKKATYWKKIAPFVFFILILFLVVSLSADEFENNIETKVAIIIDPNLLADIRDGLNIFEEDLQNEGYTVVERLSDFDNPLEVRAYLQAQYETDNNFVGAFLIGKIPYAYQWVISHSTNPDIPSTEKEAISFQFYSDIDGIFESSPDYTSPGGHEYSYDIHTGEVDWEIWIGVLPIYKGDYSTTISAMNRYFEKNHAYRNGEYRIHRAFMEITEHQSASTIEEHNTIVQSLTTGDYAWTPFSNGTDAYFYFDSPTADLSVSQGYSALSAGEADFTVGDAHGYWGAHGDIDISWVENNEVSTVFFWSNGCSVGNIEFSDNFLSSLVYSPTSAVLVAKGTTNDSGGMGNNENGFFGHNIATSLSYGSDLGQAILEHVNVPLITPWSLSREFHFATNILVGDPTLKIRPFIDSDNDGIPDDQDLCAGYDDTIDEDSDGIPDGCDDSIVTQGFDYQSYLSFNADLPQTWTKSECMEHYKLFGFWEKRAVSFNLDEYLNANPDLPKDWTYEIALSHYNIFGKNENRLLAFDAQEYLSLYPDLPQDWTYDQAWAHYIYFGKLEGRIASFDETAYLELYKDLPSSWEQSESFYHYLYYGKNEGRVYDPYDENVFINGTMHSACTDSECFYEDRVDYLIITRLMFLRPLQDFVNWKNDEGFRVGVLTAEWISEDEPGLIIAEAIKEKLRFFKDKKTAKFALLVGDTIADWDCDYPCAPIYHLTMDSLDDPWNIPTGYYYRNLLNETYVSEEFTDVFYADLDSWDPDGNGVNDCVDSVNSDIDDFIFVGRWPVRTEEEVEAVALKTMEASSAIERGLGKEMLVLEDRTLSGDSEIPSECYGDYLSETGFLAWYLKSQCERGWTGITRAMDDIGFDVDRYYSDTFSETSFLDKFYDGLPIMEEFFHGNHNAIGVPLSGGEEILLYMDDSHDFKGETVVMSTVSCSVGSFFLYHNDSFNEQLLKKENGPAIVVSPTFDYHFYKKLAQGYSVGEAFYYSKIVEQKAKEAFEDRQECWLGSGNGVSLQGGDNLLGDPSLVLYPD